MWFSGCVSVHGRWVVGSVPLGGRGFCRSSHCCTTSVTCHGGVILLFLEVLFGVLFVFFCLRDGTYKIYLVATQKQ